MNLQRIGIVKVWSEWTVGAGGTLRSCLCYTDTKVCKAMSHFSLRALTRERPLSTLTASFDEVVSAVLSWCT